MVHEIPRVNSKSQHLISGHLDRHLHGLGEPCSEQSVHAPRVEYLLARKPDDNALFGILAQKNERMISQTPSWNTYSLQHGDLLEKLGRQAQGLLNLQATLIGPRMRGTRKERPIKGPAITSGIAATTWDHSTVLARLVSS